MKERAIVVLCSGLFIIKEETVRIWKMVRATIEKIGEEAKLDALFLTLSLSAFSSWEMISN